MIFASVQTNLNGRWWRLV